MSRHATFILSILTILSVAANAQTVAGLPEQISSPGYDPAALFAPGFYGDLHLATRSANGAPSPAYWQNRADYTLSVRLDTTHNEIEGSASIRYTNNSPDSLHTLWLYLDQQTYRADARSNYFTGFTPTGHTEGYEPNITDKIVELAISANGGKIATGSWTPPPPPPPPRGPFG